MANTSTTTPAPAASRPLGPRAVLTAIGNEVTKGLRHAWAERVQILIELPLFASFVLMLGLVLGQGRQVVATGQLDWNLDDRLATWLLLGFVAFIFFYLQVVKLFWRLLAEIQTGTLEQVYLSPLPSWVLAAVGRVVATVAETIVVVAAVYGLTALVVDPELTWQAGALIPLLLLMVSTVGYSLVIAGLTLVWKRIEMVNEVLLVIVMLFSGAVLPLDGFPGWVATGSRILPVTDGVAGLRRVLLHGQPLAVWGQGGLVPLLINATAWLLAGAVLFSVADRIAKRQGSLSHY